MINAYLLNRWRILLRGRYFWLRSMGASIIGDSITVILGLTLIYAGKVSTDQLISNIIPQLIVLLLCSSIGSVPATIIAKVVAKLEGLDTQSSRIDFNPFK